MYTYYTKVELEEHQLYASEVANALGFMSLSGKPHSQLLSFFLQKANKNLGIAQLYYKTRMNLVPVYSTVAITLAYKLIQESDLKQVDGHYSIHVDNKQFNFIKEARNLW